MNVHAAIRDIQALRSIVATLIALAALAERVGARSYPVRFLALCFLRPAEAVAREFVAGAAPTQRLAGNAMVENGPADPIRLASRFRALAAALSALLRLVCRLGCWNARFDGVVRQIASCAGTHPVTLGGRDSGPNDTS